MARFPKMISTDCSIVLQRLEIGGVGEVDDQERSGYAGYGKDGYD